MNFKLKPGDRVRILNGASIRDYAFDWAPDMINYVGREAIILRPTSCADKPAYYLEGINYKWDERGLILVDSSDSGIKDVIFNNPATIVLWEDGTKTVVKCQEGDTYSKELGLAMCISKKYLGNKGNFNEVFKKWIPEEKIAFPEWCGEDADCSECSHGYEDGCKLVDQMHGETDKKYPVPEKEKPEPDETPEPEDDISVEEMRQRLQKHCDNVPWCGTSCVLNENYTNCNFLEQENYKYVVPDEKIREAYKLIKNKEDK